MDKKPYESKSFKEQLKENWIVIAAIGAIIAVVGVVLFLSNTFKEEEVTLDNYEYVGLVRDTDPKIGKIGSPVRVTVVENLLCGFCADYDDTKNQIIEKYQDQVEFTFKVVSVSPESQDEAVAVLAAGEQGYYEDLAKLIFAEQDAVRLASNSKIKELAQTIGGDFDFERWNDERLNNKELERTAKENNEDLNKFGEEQNDNFGTPTTVIYKNGEVIEALSGVQTFEDVDALIQSALNE